MAADHSNLTYAERVTIVVEGKIMEREFELQHLANPNSRRQHVNPTNLSRRLGKSRKTVRRWWNRRDDLWTPTGLKNDNKEKIGRPMTKSLNSEEKLKKVVKKLKDLPNHVTQQQAVELLNLGCTARTLRTHTSSKKANLGVWKMPTKRNPKQTEAAKRHQVEYAKSN